MPFDGIRKPHLVQVAAQLYSAQLPYHNFSHYLEHWQQQNSREPLPEGGVVVNGEVVYFALLFHDAGSMKITSTRALPLRKSIQLILRSVLAR